MRKFTDRKSPVARIWPAVQRLSSDGAQQTGDGAPAKEQAQKSPAKPGKRARAKRDAEERGNKKAEAIAMMKRAKSATLAEIIDATCWQKFTVRGFVSLWAVRTARKSNPRRTPPANACIGWPYRFDASKRRLRLGRRSCLCSSFSEYCCVVNIPVTPNAGLAGTTERVAIRASAAQATD